MMNYVRFRGRISAGISVVWPAVTTTVRSAAGGTARPRAASAETASVRGPYLDLTTGKGNMLAAVRLNANLDESRIKYGSASGVVCGVRAGEAVRDLCGFEVVSAARAWKQPDGRYRLLHQPRRDFLKMVF
mgnify:CR=1 FL=1